MGNYAPVPQSLIDYAVEAIGKSEQREICFEFGNARISTQRGLADMFIENMAQQVDFARYYNGNCPSSILDIVAKYASENIATLPPQSISDFLANSSNKAIKMSFIAFDLNDSGITYQNDVVIKRDKHECNVEWNLMLLSLPKNIGSVIIDYKLSSQQIGIDWQNIKKMEIGQAVDVPPVMLNVSDFLDFEKMGALSFFTTIKTLMVNC